MPHPKRLRVATYNVQNLFLAGEGEPAKSPRALTHLARTIARAKADVLCLQEVGSLESLELLNARLKQPYPEVGLLPGNSNRSIHLGFLSRWPMQLRSHRELPLTDIDGQPLLEYRCAEDALVQKALPLLVQRDFLQATVMCSDEPLQLLNVHLKSRTSRDWALLASNAVRFSEAQALSALIQKVLRKAPTSRLIVAGDFNDTWHSDALTPIRELDLLDPLGQQLRAAGRNPSTYWPKRRNRIDFLLLAPSMSDHVGEAEIAVHEQAKIASDHYPVVQTLSLPTTGVH